MKLSLYQQLVSNGEKSHTIFNPNELYSKIVDVKLEYNVNLSVMGNEILHLLLVREEGCLIYSIQKVSTRSGDYNAFILGIPMPILFSAVGDIASIMEQIDRLHYDQETDVTQLKALFDKEYKEQKFNVKLPRRSKEYARRTAANIPLDTLLSTHILQTEYAKYEGVFLVSQAQAEIPWRTVTDLTSHPLTTPVLVSPPAKSRKEGAKNCTVFINEEKMTQSVLCHEGDIIQLRLHREGFADIIQNYPVTKGGKIILPDNIQWMKIVPQDTFHVTCEGDSSDNPQGIAITIQGAETDAQQQCFLIPEGQTNNVSIMVTRQDYEPKTLKNINLNNYSPLTRLEIPLKRERKTITYKVKGQNISFELKRTSQELRTSPLPGYVVEAQKGDTITLKQENTSFFKGWQQKQEQESTSLMPVHDTTAATDQTEEREHSKRRGKRWFNISKWNRIRILTGLLSGLIIGGLVGEWHGRWAEKQAAEAERVRQIAEADSIQRMNIINYLDTIPKWRKAEMDTIFGGKLNGMYDSLNYFNLDKVYWRAEELGIATSKQLERIDSAKDAMTQDSEYYKKVKEMTHNEDSTGREFFSKDGTITLNNLFEHLKKAQQEAEQAKKTNQTQVP